MFGSDAVLRIQEEDDGSFLADIPALRMYYTSLTLDGILGQVREAIEKDCSAEKENSKDIEQALRAIDNTIAGLSSATKIFSDSAIPFCIFTVENYNEYVRGLTTSLHEHRDENISKIQRINANSPDREGGICELLEQWEMVEASCRMFRINHPIEQHFGKPVRCVVFCPYKDIDGDGDIDLGCAYYFRRRIKVSFRGDKI